MLIYYYGILPQVDIMLSKLCVSYTAWLEDFKETKSDK
jgi:hypothetical protein